MKKTAKKIIVISCLAVATASLSTSISLAAFFAADAIDQTISYSGARDQSIYLDLQAWHNLDALSAGKYYMFVFNNSNGATDWIEPETTVASLDSITIGGTDGVSDRYLKLFLFDAVKYEGFDFVRIKGSASGPSWDDKTHQTRGIIYSPNYHNYYRITNVGGDSEYAQERSSYISKMIYEDEDGLTFDNPAS